MNFSQAFPDGYPEEYTHGIPINYLAPVGYTWPLKVDAIEAKKIQSDLMVWLTQYQEEPTAEQGEIFHTDWWRAYDHIDHINSKVVFEDGSEVPFLYKAIYADTAMKTQERHDYSSLQCWVYLTDDRIALIDNETAKWEAPDLEEHFIAFCERWAFQTGVINMGVRSHKVEDKASGIGLIQAINKMPNQLEVEGIPRDKDKVSRAKSCAPQIKRGKVLLPASAPWLGGYLTEFQKFNSAMTHKNDDQIDATLDAINDMLIGSVMIGYGRVIGGK